MNLRRQARETYTRVTRTAEAGLVTRDQRGKWAYYRVAPEALAALGNMLRPSA